MNGRHINAQTLTAALGVMFSLSVSLWTGGCAAPSTPLAQQSTPEVAPSAPAPTPSTIPEFPSEQHANANAPDEEWINFLSPDGDFAVELPGKPMGEHGEVSTPIGSQSVVRFTIQRDGALYNVGYLTRSRRLLTSLISDERILTMACKRTARNMGGRIVRSQKITIDGFSTCQIEVEIPDEGQLRCATARLIITKQRIYHTIVTSPCQSQPDAGAERFLRSFHILHGTSSSVAPTAKAR